MKDSRLQSWKSLSKKSDRNSGKVLLQGGIGEGKLECVGILSDLEKKIKWVMIYLYINTQVILPLYA